MTADDAMPQVQMNSRYLLCGLLCFFAVAAHANNDDASAVAEHQSDCKTIEIFYQPGCPHCSRAFAFIGQLKADHPDINVLAYDVAGSPTALEQFRELNEKLGIDRPGVPSFLICEVFFVGYDDAAHTGNRIRSLLGLEAGEAPAESTAKVDIPFFGDLNYERLGLPLFTIAIGLVDGFNPCAMWVLLFLLSLLVNLKNRRRMLLIAGTFVFISGAVYFAFMAAWLNIYLIIGFSRSLQIGLGTLAILIGLINIKDYFAFKKGVSLSIPDSAKPGIYARVRRVIQAENLFVAIAAISVLAILVNFLELLCTAGLPALYTQILSLQALTGAQYYGYLALYNLAYIFDDALMVGVVVYTLGGRKIQEQQGRWLKLLSGSVIALLGAGMLFFPNWLV